MMMMMTTTTATQTPAPMQSLKKAITQKKKAFSLIELAIIIGIIGIMSAVAVTQFVDLSGSAEEAVLSDYLQKLNTGVASFIAVKGHRPDDFEDFVAGTAATLTPSSGKSILLLSDKAGTVVCTNPAAGSKELVCGGFRAKSATYTLNAGAITMALTTKTTGDGIKG